MNNKVLFSVVVPIYKVELYLKQCIDSLVNQTYDNLEIILVDDGSPDDCGKICDEYAKKDGRIKVVHKENGGLVSARKAGAEIALGDYIACIDGDDWIELSYFEKFSEVIVKYNPDVICCGEMWEYKKKANYCYFNLPSGYYTKENIKEKVFPFLIENKRGTEVKSNIWGKVFRRALYIEEQMKVDDSIKIGEDQACVKPILFRADSLYVMSECIYHYRQNISSMTKEGKPRKWNDALLLSEHFRARIDISMYDFEDQLECYMFHALFSIILSNFTKGRKYKDVVRDVCAHIRKLQYQTVIDNAKFYPITRGYIAQFFLKHRLFFVIYLFKKFIM